jgi:hypothetical protein
MVVFHIRRQTRNPQRCGSEGHEELKYVIASYAVPLTMRVSTYGRPDTARAASDPVRSELSI